MSLASRIARALERPAAIAWKDLLVFAKTATGWKGVIGALVLLTPLVAFAALTVETAGPWRHFAPFVGLVFAALFSTFSFAVTVPAATSLALERDRDTLPALVVSPLTAGELVVGKLAAAVANALVAKMVFFPALAIAYALGGIEAALIPGYFLVLVAADVSFASFALALTSRPLRPSRMSSPAFKLGVSQAQLALQRTVGFSVLGSLLPIYASVFGVPLLLQQNLALGRWLETAGALGAVHPLFALVAWGPVSLFGGTLPVWALAVGFHLLLALPLLAVAAESQRGSGGERGRLPRLAFLAWFAFVVTVAAGTLWERSGEVRALVPAALGGALLMGAAISASVAPPRRAPFGRRDVLLALVDPRRAFTSAPETAPGFALLLALALGPFVFAAAPAGAAVRACGGLLLAALGVGAIGARLAARAQAKDAAEFEKAVERRRESEARARGEAAEGETAAVEEPSSGASYVFGIGFNVLLLGPAAAFLGLLAAARIPAVAPFEPVFKALGIVTLAANPGAALLPLVDPRSALGQLLAAELPRHLGLEPAALASLGLAIWSAVTLVAFATLRRARRVELL